MSPAPTVILTCDYLVEITDDGTQSEPGGPEIILAPPPPADADPMSQPGTVIEPEPQP